MQSGAVCQVFALSENNKLSHLKCGQMTRDTVTMFHTEELSQTNSLSAATCFKCYMVACVSLARSLLISTEHLHLQMVHLLGIKRELWVHRASQNTTTDLPFNVSSKHSSSYPHYPASSLSLSPQYESIICNHIFPHKVKAHVLMHP